MRFLLAFLLILVSCAVGPRPSDLSSGWVAWNPKDPEIVAHVEADIRRSTGELEDLDVQELFDLEPLLFVPDARFRSVFPELPKEGRRVYYCQLGSPGGGIASLRFSPRVATEGRTRVPSISCQHDEEAEASLCTYLEEEWFFLGDPSNFVRVSDSVDVEFGLRVLRAVYEGRAKVVIPGFEDSGWPKDWYRGLAGALLGRETLTDRDDPRFELLLGGCGCRTSLVFGEKLELDPDNPVFEDISTLCI